MTPSPTQWPRIRDLPEQERKPFADFLIGQTVPVIEGEPMDAEHQDGYYSHDYRNWKSKPENRYFD